MAGDQLENRTSRFAPFSCHDSPGLTSRLSIYPIQVPEHQGGMSPHSSRITRRAGPLILPSSVDFC